MSGNLMIVEKIGGGGSQDADSIIMNAERFAAEPDLVAVAFSGPGGVHGRATDRMIAITKLHDAGISYIAELSDAERQFTKIAEGVGDLSLADNVMRDIRAGLENGHGYPWVRMRPEFFARAAYAHVLAQAGVQTKLINPVRSMYVGLNGGLDLDRSARGLGNELDTKKLNLVVGFAARRADATMDNMSRGSTDLVGAAVSTALWWEYGERATVKYILRKDEVKGVMRVSPKIVDNAEVADQLSTGEVEALALGGSEVVYADVLKLIEGTWAKGDGVFMDVRSTFDVLHPGTQIVPMSKRVLDPLRPIAGIASQPVDAFKWADAASNNRHGPVADVSRVFAEHGVSVTDVQTGQGGVILTYVPSDDARQHAQMTSDLRSLNGSSANVEVTTAQELVVVVGDGLREPSGWGGVLNRIGAVAAMGDVRLGSINHLDGEPNIAFTVSADKAPGFIRALYNDFFPTTAK